MGERRGVRGRQRKKEDCRTPEGQIIKMHQLFTTSIKQYTRCVCLHVCVRVREHKANFVQSSYFFLWCSLAKRSLTGTIINLMPQETCKLPLSCFPTTNTHTHTHYCIMQSEWTVLTNTLYMLCRE